MSKYKKIETEFRNIESLTRALTEAGVPFEAAHNPQHPSLPMYGYHADLRHEQASIVIRRQWVNKNWSSTGSFSGASNDIGFAWDGKRYSAIVSDYDSNQSGVTAGLNSISQKYAVFELRKKALQTGRTVEQRMLADGTIELVLTKR